ncbi:retropepsin-like aspartic protease family protein [Alteraurantiacibacter aquimixticola]|uniref:TIGR02281 family clan AA aspartic protease n=1 Tax=Alteraurantiacibacter aquimixticola TaxID=2489173 RepID=A0A4T3F1K9_9SPHN|nr:TIGR02281 family clan AA aspartic protease [Alteraurantiacibacter aquimixticola]TIX51085.1 TIGR02281 family clan AA aspartic protease [Alteraurantiacibacter aquimixticola]
MDIKIPLALVLIAGGAIGLMLPMDGGFEQDAPETAANPDGNSTSAQVNLAQAPAANTGSEWAEGVQIQRAGDGHFYADVRTGGQNILMLVDTGASVVALTAEDAQAMGITWFDEDVQPVAQGAGGPVYGVTTMIDHMSVGDLEASNVEAVVITRGARVSLLGQSFLSRVGTVSISGDTMSLAQ